MKNLFFLLILIILFSCSENKRGNSIELDLSKSSNRTEYRELFDSVANIILETEEECLIGNIDQILRDDTLLFILDKHQKNIFIFSDSGKFIRKIDQIGKGEGEYISTTSFCVDAGRDIVYLLDDMQQKILKYNYAGSYLGKLQFKYEDIIRSIGILPTGHLIFFTPDYMSRGRDGVWEVDNEGTFIREFRRVNPQHKLIFIPFPYYSNCMGKISFYDGFTDQIFSIKDNKLQCEYQFDLKQKVPDKYLKNEDGVNHNGTGFFYMNNSITEAGNHYYLRFRSNKRGDIHVFFEKDTESLIITDSLKNDLDGGQSPTNIYSYDEHALLAVIWGKDQTLNPELQLLFLKNPYKCRGKD